MINKRVVITGGAGFIGSNLAVELGKHNEVILVDDFSTGRKENIEELMIKENMRLVEGSITDLHLVQRVCQGIDYVFHQAAIPSVPRSIENPKASHEANVNGTLNVLLAARDKGVKKVIFASSSSVYGDTPTLPKREDMIPRPMSPYAVTKLAGEYYCQIFTQVYSLPTICLRYFNVYGPRQDPNSQYAAVVPRFIENVLKESPFTIFGGGEQTRDFTFIKDVVRANILAAESDATGVFNIGRGNSVTINDLAKCIVNLLGKDLTPIHGEPRPGDVRHSLADVSKARMFSYKPEYSLEDGLRETIKWFCEGETSVTPTGLT